MFGSDRCLNTSETGFLASLMTVWNQTAHYEDLLIEHKKNENSALFHASLHDLFTHLVRAMNGYYYWHKNHLGETELQSRADILIDKLKILEHNTHLQASLYLQSKQIEMLDSIQQQQDAMTAKIEEAMAVKMKVLEENMNHELRFLRTTLLNSIATPSQPDVNGADEKETDAIVTPDTRE